MRIAALVVSLLALLLLLPESSLAQGMGDAIARQNLRGYTHMFIAYGIAWLLVLGWAISIFRRLGRIEEALKD
jgi:CcmD family protein